MKNLEFRNVTKKSGNIHFLFSNIYGARAQTLVYGSPDGGFTIRDSDALLNGKMAEVAKVCIITVVYDLYCSCNLNKI